MKVKIFDESHEADLEERVNEFLSEHTDIIDIKFQVSIAMFSEEQIYCFFRYVLSFRIPHLIYINLQFTIYHTIW